jgi:hypothetical protein
VKEPLELPKVATPRLALVEFTVEYASASATGGGTGVDFATSMKIELPGILYKGFVDALPAYDRHSVPLNTVSDAAAYRRLKGTGIHDVPLTPSVEESVRYPVDGLLCLAGDQPQTDAAIVELLEEVDADYALQVRLRLGVRSGKASIEKGSTVRIVGRKGSGLLETRLALVSAESVTENEPDSEVAAINSRLFVHAVERLFRPCIGMALIRTGRV